MRRVSLLLVALAPALALAGPAAADDSGPEWHFVDSAVRTAASVDDLTALSLDFPDSSSVSLRLIDAQLAAGDAGLTDEAMVLAMTGYALNPAAEAKLAAAIDEYDADSFTSFMDSNREPIEASKVVATLPAEAKLVEGVARDPETGDLYATTIVGRALYRKHGGDPWQKVAIDGAGSLAGIAWDPKRKLFWIASGKYDETPAGYAYGAALGFDPKQGKVVRTLYANGEVPLGDIAVSDSGIVYAANPVAGEIHMADPDTDDGFRALIGAGVFASPQGMVPVPQSDLIVISDYRYGLAVLDTKRGKVWRVVSGTTYLDGIDALQLHGHSLIAVQNGHSPKRIVRLDMSQDWLGVEGWTVLEQAVPGWTEPVGGTVDGDELLYIGTGQWDRFGKGGEASATTPPGPTEVRSLPLGD